MSNLFDEFSPVTAEQWKQQVIKDLKGENFEEKLLGKTADGIETKPFYTSEDLSEKKPEPLFTHTEWAITEEKRVNGNEKALNKQILEHLNEGITGVWLHAKDNLNAADLFAGVETPYIFSAISFSENPASSVDGIRGIFSQAAPALLWDPLACALQKGKWQKDQTGDLNDLKQMLESGRLDHFCNGAVYGAAGATSVYQLASVACTALEYLSMNLLENGRPFYITMEAGTNYFEEISKFRALYKIWALIEKAFGKKIPMHLHVSVSEQDYTLYDAYNNLLRATTSAMSAKLGGCHSLSVKPFDSTFKKENDFSDRMARNIQLILQHESYFDQMSDVAAGSFYLESLTDSLAQKAWGLVKETEKNGGLIKALVSGNWQHSINNQLQTAIAKLESGKKILVGTNKFPNEKEKMRDKTEVPVSSKNTNGSELAPLTPHRLSAGLESQRLEKE